MSVYNTKEWKNKREKIIKNKKCAWCGSTDNLVVHHTDPPKLGLTAYKNVEEQYFNQYFSNGKNKEEYDNLVKKARDWVDNHKKIRTRCPECGKSTLYYRKTMFPKYRCTNCKYIGNKAVKEETIPSLDRSIAIEFSKTHRKEIKKAYQEYKKEANKKYLDLKTQDTLILCKRCHFANHKGLTLCKNCGENYHKNRHDMCWNCFTKTPKGKKIKEQREQMKSEH